MEDVMGIGTTLTQRKNALKHVPPLLLSKKVGITQ